MNGFANAQPSSCPPPPPLPPPPVAASREHGAPALGIVTGPPLLPVDSTDPIAPPLVATDDDVSVVLRDAATGVGTTNAAGGDFPDPDSRVSHGGSGPTGMAASAVDRAQRIAAPPSAIGRLVPGAQQSARGAWAATMTPGGAAGASAPSVALPSSASTAGVLSSRMSGGTPLPVPMPAPPSMAAMTGMSEPMSLPSSFSTVSASPSTDPPFGASARTMVPTPAAPLPSGPGWLPPSSLLLQRVHAGTDGSDSTLAAAGVGASSFNGAPMSLLPSLRSVAAATGASAVAVTPLATVGAEASRLYLWPGAGDSIAHVGSGGPSGSGGTEGSGSNGGGGLAPAGLETRSVPGPPAAAAPLTLQFVDGLASVGSRTPKRRRGRAAADSAAAAGACPSTGAPAASPAADGSAAQSASAGVAGAAGEVLQASGASPAAPASRRRRKPVAPPLPVLNVPTLVVGESGKPVLLPPRVAQMREHIAKAPPSQRAAAEQYLRRFTQLLERDRDRHGSTAAAALDDGAAAAADIRALLQLPPDSGPAPTSGAAHAGVTPAGLERLRDVSPAAPGAAAAASEAADADTTAAAIRALTDPGCRMEAVIEASVPALNGGAAAAAATHAPPPPSLPSPPATRALTSGSAAARAAARSLSVAGLKVQNIEEMDYPPLNPLDPGAAALGRARANQLLPASTQLREDLALEDIPTCKQLYNYLRKVTGVIGEDDTCNLWTAKTVGGQRFKRGNMHGMFWFQSKMRLAHRLSHLWFRGPIPPGYEVLHNCQSDGNCVNPRHLYIETKQFRIRITRRGPADAEGTEAGRSPSAAGAGAAAATAAGPWSGAAVAAAGEAVGSGSARRRRARALWARLPKPDRPQESGSEGDAGGRERRHEYAQQPREDVDAAAGSAAEAVGARSQRRRRRRSPAERTAEDAAAAPAGRRARARRGQAAQEPERKLPPPHMPVPCLWDVSLLPYAQPPAPPAPLLAQPNQPPWQHDARSRFHAYRRPPAVAEPPLSSGDTASEASEVSSDDAMDMTEANAEHAAAAAAAAADALSSG